MSFGRGLVAQRMGQRPERNQSARNAAAPLRMHGDGQPAAAYTWYIAPGDVLVVVDENREGWRSVTNHAVGVVGDLAALRPDLLARVPAIPYRDSMGWWDALLTTRTGTFDGIALVGASNEAEAVAWALAQSG